jgi:ribosomal peptide maturation radical SAM protein 1
MPWESVARPSLATGTLCALARRTGYRCTALHLNLNLAGKIGLETYQAFAETLELFPLGEHLFAVDLFGTDVLDSTAYLARFGGVEASAGEDPDPLHVLRDRDIPDYLTEAAQAVLRLAPDVVGFSCTFNQVLPSLALARRLKAARPGVTVIFGGACVHGAMGLSYAEGFPEWIDYVFTGEADDSFLAWLDAFDSGEPARAIAGVAGGPEYLQPRLTHDLDRLPVPEFDEFFAQREALEEEGFLLPEVRHLPYESSRGCWWGEKHHCTFCGLNNQGMTYRRKSPERVVAELEALAQVHGLTSFMAADNILDFRAYRELLLNIEKSPVDYDLFYEIKANVRRADIATLRRAGVWRVQPGVESFADHVLELMRKGVTGLRNVQLLKWLQEYGVAVDYNILIGFPGETSDDYEELIRVMRSIPHLPPPNGRATIVRVDRFSPFFDDAEALGIRGMRAADYYRHLIPEQRLEPERYAYFFDRDLDDLDRFENEISEVNRIMTDWKAGDTQKRARLGAGFIEVVTYSERRMRRRVLRGLEAQIFLLSDAQVTRDELRRRLTSQHDGEHVDGTVDELLAAEILVGAGDSVVGAIPFAEPHSDFELNDWAGVTRLGWDGLAPAAGRRASRARHAEVA